MLIGEGRAEGQRVRMEERFGEPVGAEEPAGEAGCGGEGNQVARGNEDGGEAAPADCTPDRAPAHKKPSLPFNAPPQQPPCHADCWRFEQKPGMAGEAAEARMADPVAVDEEEVWPVLELFESGCDGRPLAEGEEARDVGEGDWEGGEHVLNNLKRPRIANNHRGDDPVP